MKEIPSNSIPDNKEPDLHKLIRHMTLIIGGLVSFTYLSSEAISAFSPVPPVDNSVNGRLNSLNATRNRILIGLITDEEEEVLEHIHEEMMRILPEEVLLEEQKMPVIQE